MWLDLLTLSYERSQTFQGPVGRAVKSKVISIFYFLIDHHKPHSYIYVAFYFKGAKQFQYLPALNDLSTQKQPNNSLTSDRYIVFFIKMFPFLESYTTVWTTANALQTYDIKEDLHKYTLDIIGAIRSKTNAVEKFCTV